MFASFKLSPREWKWCGAPIVRGLGLDGQDSKRGGEYLKSLDRFLGVFSVTEATAVFVDELARAMVHSTLSLKGSFLDATTWSVSQQ